MSDGKKRTVHSAEFKAKVGMEAVRGGKTLNEIGQQYGGHPVGAGQWRRRLLTNVPRVFEEKKNDVRQDHQAVVEELHRKIGQLHVELDWLKKKSGL